MKSIRSIPGIKGADVGAKHLIFLLVFVAAVFLRFWNLAVSPYYEWDEPVYASIGAHVAQTGAVQVKTEISSDASAYLYHPPFYFLLLGEWFNRFGVSIEVARILSALMSTVTLAMLFFFLMTYDGGRVGGALFALFLLGMDGWMIFSNRVSWIENTMMPIGIMGLWVYGTAIKAEKPQFWRYWIAGIVLAAAGIFKHVGLYFLLAVPICWLLIGRKHAREHILLAVAAALMILVYVSTMYLTYGDIFLEHYGVQIRRTFGFQKARGIVENLGHVWAAVSGNYRVYAGMMITAAIALGLFVKAAYRAVTLKTLSHLENNALLFSCTAAALLFFGSISLKIPHYYLMVLVPLYAFAAIEIAHLVRLKPNMKKVVGGVTALIFAANLYTVVDLFAHRQKNAGAELRQYFDENEPLSTVVIAEETTGTLLRQPYLKLGGFRRHLLNGDFRKYQPSHLVIYRSITQHPPDLPELERLIEVSMHIRTFEDFKCTLSVYRIPKSLWKEDTLVDLAGASQ